jgi:hypothetical protein
MSLIRGVSKGLVGRAILVDLDLQDIADDLAGWWLFKIKLRVRNWWIVFIRIICSSKDCSGVPGR